MSRMGRLQRDIISTIPSVVSICGNVPIQEAPNGSSCAVSDARVRIGCIDPVDYDQFQFSFFFHI